MIDIENIENPSSTFGYLQVGDYFIYDEGNNVVGLKLNELRSIADNKINAIVFYKNCDVPDHVYIKEGELVMPVSADIIIKINKYANE